MNVQEVVTRTQRIFGDEAGVQITEDDVIRWINDAQEQIAINNDGLMEATGTTDTVQGQAQYDYPPDLAQLRSLRYKGYRIKYMSLSEFDEYVDGYSAQPGISPYGPGIPEVYTIWNNQITLFPTPNESLTGSLSILYTKHPASVATLADSLAVPVEYHNAVVDYCLQKAYELDEDYQKAEIKKTNFEDATMKLSERNKQVQEYYPRITTLPEDENYGTYGYWGGYY